MSIGTNIKKRRFELRMSQQDLADALGYKTRSTIAKIESGENDLTQKKLARFAEVLDTTVEALISGDSTARGIAFAPPAAQDATGRGDRNRTVAVILAGGKSSRNQQNIPNQFINILGKPVIAYCLEAYQMHPSIDDLYVVCLKGWEKIVSAYAEQYGIAKYRGLIPGAASGILSIKNALEFLKDRYGDEDIIIFQEATRPLISFDMISKLLQSCYESDAVTLCQSMSDYLQFSLTDGRAAYVDRETTVCSESPEAYRFRVIADVFETAQKKQLPLTESCFAMLMYNLGYKINFVKHGANNMKIVRQEDVGIATSLLRQTHGGSPI